MTALPGAKLGQVLPAVAQTDDSRRIAMTDG